MVDLNLNLTGAQRYRQAVRKVRIRADREMREFMRGERDCLEGLFDRERAAIIAEFDRLSDELRKRPATHAAALYGEYQEKPLG